MSKSKSSQKNKGSFFRRLRWRFFVVLMLTVLGLSAWLLLRESQRVLSHDVSAWTTDHVADCAIVLTGGASRVRAGFDLLYQGSVKKLIISGVYPGAQLREIFPQLPYYGSLNPNDVSLERRSKTTYGNAQQTLPLVEALRCRDVVLITSRLHMYRALKSFKALYPPEIVIYPRSIVSGHYVPRPTDILEEAIKSLFYSIWAY